MDEGRSTHQPLKIAKLFTVSSLVGITNALNQCGYFYFQPTENLASHVKGLPQR